MADLVEHGRDILTEKVRKVDLFSSPVRGGKGYLMIDERAPGLGLKEFKTLTCAHCNSVVVLNEKRKRPRGYCAKCHAYVCDNKACAELCTPTLQMVELAQKHPGVPFLPRDYNGGILFDPAFLQEGKLY